MTISGNIVDVHQRRIFHGAITVENGRIKAIRASSGSSDQYLLPGFVDAHIHIESSMLVPSEFAKLAVVHGTVATVSDPHEIANVLGAEGVRYMIRNGQEVPLKFNFGAPSCVPATDFETAGAALSAAEVKTLLEHEDIRYLSEMMNYPGVLFRDPEVMKKISIARSLGKPVDGHAPGLRGQQARDYIDAGISTDHECFSYAEAREKLEYGMHIIIREGSAAKNYKALIPLLAEFPEKIMFCSDDKHPDDLLLGHINQLVARALTDGYDLFDVLRAACVNPVKHYMLEVGLLRENDSADFIVVNDLSQMKVSSTFINGVEVSRSGRCLFSTKPATVINNFHCSKKKAEDFALLAEQSQIKVIRAIDGEIVTEVMEAKARVEQKNLVSDPNRDILKITVVNRYSDQIPAVAFIHGFGLKKGALASCVGHDSHNIIAVGVDDLSICKAVNAIIEQKGGISACSGEEERVLPLPVAGIMSNADGLQVAEQYGAIDAFAKSELCCSLTAPFMTLSFMGLLVIPQLKLSDRGLFDGSRFTFTSIFSS